MNSKNYRDLVLDYVQKLGEIDKAEDERVGQDQLSKLKKEASDLKQKIDNSRKKK